MKTNSFIIRDKLMRYVFQQSEKAQILAHDTGEISKLLLSGEQSEGKVCIFDSELPAGHFAPMHYHDFDDEIFYIISGEVEFGVEKQVFVAKKGDLVMAGPNVKRRFKALTDSRILVINAIAEPAENFMFYLTQFNQSNPMTQEHIRKIENEFGIHIVKE